MSQWGKGECVDSESGSQRATLSQGVKSELGFKGTGGRDGVTGLGCSV